MVLSKNGVISESDFQDVLHSFETHKHVYATLSAPTPEKGKCEFDQYWDMMDTTGDVPQHSSSQVLNKPNWCKMCEKSSCQEVDGYFVCTQCGEVGASCIDSDAEWRVFSKDDNKGDKSRCGDVSSNYLSASSHAEGTVISCKWKESAQMRNARQYHKWNSCNSNGRNLYAIFDELQRHAYKNGFNHMIVEDTKHLYKETTDYHLFRGVNRKGLYAYCLYHTCKKKNVPRSIKEISKIFGLNPHVMTKGHTAFNKVLREHEKLKDRKDIESPDESPDESHNTDCTNDNPSTILTTTKPRNNQRKKANKKCNKGSKITMLAKPVDFVARFCSHVGMNSDITQKVHDLTLAVTQKRLVSDSPSLITSACMMVVITHYQLPLSSSDVQQVSNISHVTIDKCYKKLMVFYEDLVGCL